MKIGTLLTLEFKKAQQTIKYRCKVIEKNEKYLFIDYPIDTETKKTAYLSKGTKLSATYIGNDQSIYNFRTEIVKKVKLVVPALAIPLPDDDKVQRIQRREFVRIDTAIDVAIHSATNSIAPIVTVTSDISGGGVSIIIPRGRTLEEGSKVTMWIVLHMHSGQYKYITAEAEVVLLKSINNTIQTASLKFTDITKQAQQTIIRYCFEKQRETRKKELSI
ncbi:flagellar brake domain-containing protein [Virgibacillus sp. C22-A2]|uniref:Flagellar brake domain-containing protein n=1 Tax=Virgibacillus tibetensis TaxID=3042313 RepID=A0ABU6KC02_9BACI|nr:flagellar brake domain-containing protein [Virgibacillus sp. C22-A2]